MALHASTCWFTPGDPSAPNPSEEGRPDRDRTPRRPGGGVLVIEDDDAIRETLADILQYEGYAVTTASDGREALARLRSGPYPALILLDLMMPRMNGWEFRAEQLVSQEFAAIPVIVLSGAHDGQRQATFLNASGFLPKPIEVLRLLEVVRHYCG